MGGCGSERGPDSLADVGERADVHHRWHFVRSNEYAHFKDPKLTRTIVVVSKLVGPGQVETPSRQRSRHPGRFGWDDFQLANNGVIANEFLVCFEDLAGPSSLRRQPLANGVRTAVVAWLVTAVYYFYQYALRSAPAVMMPQLSKPSASARWVWRPWWALLLRLFAVQPGGRRGHGPAGTARGGPAGRGRSRHRRAPVRDRQQPGRDIGRFLQGAGGVFALVGAAYIATTNFPASRAATLIGATQMFGMAGGSAGQFVVGPIIGAAFPGALLDRHGVRRPGDQRSSLLPAAGARPSAARRLAQRRGRRSRHGLPQPAVDLCG